MIRFLALLFAATTAHGALVPDVEKAVLTGDFGAADRMLAAYNAANGATAEYIEALSWIGRGQLARFNFAPADANAVQVRRLVDAQLAHRRLDAEPHLPIALGASIEVRAGVLAKQGARDQAVLLLRDELRRWRSTSIQLRLQKNLNLLTLEGKPAPPLDVSQWIGPVRPRPLAAHRGHPILLFLWAHWCPDCKAEVAAIRQLMSVYGPRGLVLIAPTQHYGYVAQGENASPAVETRYIADVYRTFYAPLGSIEIPLSKANFTEYGVSTTPTLVVVDRAGVVELYNPGAMPFDALSAAVARVIGK